MDFVALDQLPGLGQAELWVSGVVSHNYLDLAAGDRVVHGGEIEGEGIDAVFTTGCERPGLWENFADADRSRLGVGAVVAIDRNRKRSQQQSDEAHVQ